MIHYRGFTIQPAPGKVVAVRGPTGDFRGRFVDAAAARRWIDALLARAPAGAA